MSVQALFGKNSAFGFWILVLIAALAILVVPFPQTRQPTQRNFRVEASQFAYLPSTLRVNPGDRVTIELVSRDVVHGLAVDDYGVEVSADPGQSNSLTFTADRSGSFRLRCSVTCGNMHPFMIGRLQVGRNELLWRGIGLSVLVVVSTAWRGLR